ncbi:hypothetical protein Tco_1137307 [Tanacetum coccineum]
MPAQSDPLGHLHEELHILNTKVDQLKSSISKKVANDIQSSVPSIIADALKANLPGLLLEALQNTLPQMIKDYIPQSVQESIKEKFPVFNAQVKQSLQDQLPSILKPMNKQFNAFNTLESRRTMFKDMVSLLEAAEDIKKANAEGEKWEKNNPKTPIEDNDAQNPNQTQGEQHLRDATMANAQGEQPPAQELSNVEQAPLDNEENVLVLHAFVEKSSEDHMDQRMFAQLGYRKRKVGASLNEGCGDEVLRLLIDLARLG